MNYYPIISTLLVSAAILFISSCNDKRAAHANIISEWVGREIVMPEELVYQIKDDTIDLDLSRPDYKIISYIDSTGCTSCRMKLAMWSELINELKSLPDVDVEVIMVINADDPKKITYLLQRDNYLNPVAIDSDNFFDSLNELPPKSEHHTFLLDAENKVVAIGNPVLNPKIKDIYLQQILLSPNLPFSYDNRNHQVQSLGSIRTGDKIEHTFYLINFDTITCSLQEIIPSCECISAVADFDKLSFAKRGEIKVIYTADTMPGYFNRYVDIFFNEKDLPTRLTVYGYKNNSITNQ